MNAWREGQDQVTCELPEGFKVEGKCVELLKALYGLKDSPLLWQKEFSSALRKLGLKASPEEPYLFYTEDRKVIIVFYVDDVLMLYKQQDKALADVIIIGIKAAYDLKV